jgi:hypothetical protein
MHGSLLKWALIAMLDFNSWFGAFVHADDHERARDALKDQEDGQDSVNLELRCLHKTQRWR